MVGEGHLAADPFTGPCPRHESGCSLSGGPLGPGEVDDEGGGHAPFAEQARRRLVGEVVPGHLGRLARVPDDVHLADLRVPCVHGVEVQTQPAQGRRTRGRDEHVCGREQLVDLSKPCLGLEVDRAHLLTGMQLVEVLSGELLHRVTPRRQDGDDTRSLPGQPRDGGRPGQVDGDRHDADAGQGGGHGQPRSTRVPLATRPRSHSDGRNRSP